MKKIILLTLTFICFGAFAAKAQYTGNNETQTVSEVKEMDDDAYVSLKGFIIKQLGDDDYLFKDETGEIKVDIDDDVWKGQSVDPDTKIQIRGEVDKDFRSRTVEVERLSILKE